MDSVRKIYRETGGLHHAYLLVGERELLLKSLTDFLKKDLELETEGNPDLLFFRHDSYGIDDARGLKDISTLRSLGRMKIVVLSFNSITTEAQNSLLKIFEEPSGETRFFVVAPNAEIFIPTLLSRFFVVSQRSEGELPAGANARKFLASTPKERISLIADLIENKDKTEAVRFLNSLESELSGKLHDDGKIDKEIAQACSEIIRLRGFLYSRSPSVKMILEHISCTVPLF